MRKSLIVNAKDQKNYDFGDLDESIGFFPEAVLLKERKVRVDGKRLPQDEERRHDKVVYLIHEQNAVEVSVVNQKIEDFIREKKGNVWRFEDWGLRTLTYKIKKVRKTHYILMNFEIEAQWIKEFMHMLDTDEKVIRRLVMKRKEAITKVQPPPPEFHTLHADTDDLDEEDDEFADDVEELYDRDGADVEGEIWTRKATWISLWSTSMTTTYQENERGKMPSGAKKSTRSMVVVRY